MEIRWLGEVELTFNPSFYPSLVGTLPLSVPFPCPYPSLLRISMARRQTPTMTWRSRERASTRPQPIESVAEWAVPETSIDAAKRKPMAQSTREASAGP
jgi:hypothetical protein